MFFKATGPEVAFEPRLYELLERVVPRRILVPIAIDAARGWVLLPDGGLPLGERLEGPDLVRAMESVLPLYAQLQRDLAPHADEMLAMGVADMRPAAMSDRFDEGLAAMRECIGTPTGRATPPSTTAWPRCGRRSSRGATRSGRLPARRVSTTTTSTRGTSSPGREATSPRRASTTGATRSSRTRSPACSRSASSPARAKPTSSACATAYLEVFDDLGSRGELIETLELACRVGKIARALTWYRAISAAGFDDVDERWIGGPIESMASLLDDTYLGRA